MKKFQWGLYAPIRIFVLGYYVKEVLKKIRMIYYLFYSISIFIGCDMDKKTMGQIII